MKQLTPLTAAQEILLAAADLYAEGKAEFSEWDLTVAAWKRDANRFGSRGYEREYPDHKRVMMEIMGKTKKDNPIRRGWLQKSRANFYRVTSLGLAEAEKLNRMEKPANRTLPSAQPVYDAVAAFVSHRVFQDYLGDPDEPRTWLGASAFLGLSHNTRTALEDRLRALESAANQALEWMKEQQQDLLRRGPLGGGSAIHRGELEALLKFSEILQSRFAVQMAAIRKRSK